MAVETLNSTVPEEALKISLKQFVLAFLLVLVLFSALWLWLPIPSVQSPAELKSSGLTIPQGDGYSAQSVSWLEPEEGAMITEGLLTFVFVAGNWWVCEFADDDGAYRPIGYRDTNPQDTLDISRWNSLGSEQRDWVYSLCND